MAKEEIVAVVDEDDRVIGAVPRSEMRARGLIHRATFILVFNPAGELFLQKRTRAKDIYPGWYDVAAGGVVLAGESYDRSAARELAEELGIDGVPLRPRFKFFHQEGKNRIWGRVYSCVHDGRIVLQASEVESGAFFPVDHVLRMAETERFTPDGLYALRRYLDESG